MSLRVRLSFISSLLFLSSIILGVTFLLSNAKQRVAEEVSSTANLTYQLLNTVLLNSNTTVDENNKSEIIQELLTLEESRHMSISLENTLNQPNNDQEVQTINAPSWFINLVEPEPLEFQIPLNNPQQDIIVIKTNPADEIAEVWDESRRFMSILFLALLILNGIFFFTVGYWFKPVKSILKNLNEVEKGDFNGHIPKTSLPELKVISEKLNQLTQVLKSSQAENDRLSQHSLTIQEEERRYLAQELHDEMGQSISAINAIAYSISQRTKEIDDRSAQGAKQISTITNRVRDHVSSMMSRLRPSALDELGLLAALESMIDEWNTHHDKIFCRLKTEGNFEHLDKHQQINIYRIIQEALTNVSKHSSATQVDITLQCFDSLSLIIEDNGCGFNENTIQVGMGLTGIHERSKALNGKAIIQSQPTLGVSITIQADYIN